MEIKVESILGTNPENRAKDKSNRLQECVASLIYHVPYALPISFMLPNKVTNARQETSKNQFITGMYIWPMNFLEV